MRNLVLMILMLINVCSINAQGQDIQVLLVTGGHDFEQEAFADMFDAFPGIVWEEAVQPKANQMMVAGEVEQFDLLVFYDMFQTIEENEKRAFVDLLKKGKPMLFLHHALVSYQNWEEFKNIVGGKYYEKNLYKGTSPMGYSNFLHDTEVPVEILDQSHPAVKGISNFKLFDEVYGNTETLGSVKPLLATSHPNSSKIIGWENKYGASKIIYLQPGHGKETYASENFRNLLWQSIKYLTK